MFNLKRLIKSFGYAFKGLFRTLREEQNLKIQMLISVAVISAGLYCRLDRIEWSIILLSIGAVLLAEIANSAIERITDVLRPRINTYVKEIKDIAAAAVMIASMAAIIIGVLIFYPHLANIF